MSKIKIGIIGNAEFSEPLDHALRSADSDLDLHVRLYDGQDEAIGLARELEGIVDAILF